AKSTRAYPYAYLLTDRLPAGLRTIGHREGNLLSSLEHQQAPLISRSRHRHFRKKRPEYLVDQSGFKREASRGNEKRQRRYLRGEFKSRRSEQRNRGTASDPRGKLGL